MNIVPSSQMIPIAVSAVEACAYLYFEDEKDVQKIGIALEESIANVTEFLAGNRSLPITITADANNGEFIITITDRELPGDLETTLKNDEKMGISIVHSIMDSVRFENLGMDGRRQTLVKRYKDIPGKHYGLDFVPEDVEAEGDKHTYEFRPPKEEEMLEIVRMLYNEYGNSYDVEGAYFPEHHWNNIVNDRAYFLVAVAENGEIAANMTISRVDYMPGIWDISMIFSKEKYRRGNLFGNLLERILEYAKNRGDIDGIFTELTVVHPYSQMAFNKFNFASVGYTLSMMPVNIYQPKISHHEGRGSFAESMFIFHDNPKTIYVAPDVKDFVSDIVESLNTTREIVTENIAPKHDRTVTSEDYVKVLDTGYMYFNKIGKDFPQELKRIDGNVRRQGGLTNELLINCDDPGAVFAAEEAKKQGYFCVRYQACPNGNDWMVYAKMYSDPLDYSTICTVSPYTEMLERVRKMDPEQAD